MHNNVNVTNQSNEFPTTVSVGYDTQKVATTMHVGEDGGRPPNTLTIPFEKYNEVVECAHSWKNNCEKLEEDNYVKEQTVKNRDVQLQNQNIKLHEEFVKNNNLQGDYHNAVKQIQDLELLNEEICNEFDDKIAAMGKDMGKVIRENKHLKRKKEKRKKQGIKQLFSLENYAK